MQMRGHLSPSLEPLLEENESDNDLALIKSPAISLKPMPLIAAAEVRSK